MSIFEKATRTKLRFLSPKGNLSVENLWDLPLESRDGFDLDYLYREISGEKQEADKGSIVSSLRGKQNSKSSIIDLKLEILTHIIKTKVEDENKAVDAAKISQERQQLLAALDNVKKSELAGLSAEEIQERLKKLGS